MSKNRSKFRGNIIKLLTAVLLFLELQPFYIWGFTGVPMLLTITVPLVAIMLFHSKGGKDVMATLFFGILTLFAAISEGSNFFGTIAFLMVIVLFMCTGYLKEVYGFFKVLYACLIGISCMVWVLVMFGFPIPSTEIMPLNALKVITYNQYPFLVTLGYDPEASIFRAFRFCGYFDEPGVVGTNAALMLLIDRYNFRKPTSIVIFISGILSMSLFFYVCSFLYLLYYFTLTRGKIGMKLLSVVFVGFLAVVSYNNEITHAAIWERLEYDESKGSFAGDNRADDDLKQYITRIRGTQDYWFGVHNKAIIDRYSGSASVQNAILKYGIIGIIAYVLFFLFYALKHIKNRKEALVCMGFLLITLWQRPGMYSIPYVFFYIVLILSFGRNLKDNLINYEKVANKA